jgi:hypothetical protein
MTLLDLRLVQIVKFMGQLSGKETSEINATSLADVQSGLRRNRS